VVRLNKTGYAEVNGARLYYEEGGTGEPLLLLHAGVADSRMWDAQFAEFARDFRTIRVDLRGFGLSQMPSGEFCNYEDVAEMLNVLGVERAQVLGLSFGGLIALDFALAYPDRVSALALVAPSVSGSQPSQRIKDYWEAEQEAFEDGDLEEMTELNLRFWVDGPQREAGQVDADVRALVGRMQREIFEMEIPDDIEERELQPPAVGRLAEINVPTMLVVGSLDLEEKVQQARDIAEQVADGRCVVIDESAHMVNMEKPAEFNEAVMNFLREANNV